MEHENDLQYAVWKELLAVRKRGLERVDDRDRAGQQKHPTPLLDRAAAILVGSENTVTRTAMLKALLLREIERVGALSYRQWLPASFGLLERLEGKRPTELREEAAKLAKESGTHFGRTGGSEQQAINALAGQLVADCPDLRATSSRDVAKSVTNKSKERPSDRPLWSRIARLLLDLRLTIATAVIASLFGLLFFPKLPRPMDEPIKALNEIVNAGVGVLLLTAPMAFLAWAMQRKKLRRPRVRWIAAVVFIPVVLYVAAVYIDYATVTSDARQMRQQAFESTQWKVYGSSDFDQSQSCRPEPPSPLVTCESSGGTARLAVVGRGTMASAHRWDMPTFRGDFYAEARFRPMDDSTWANCFIESDDTQPSIPDIESGKPQRPPSPRDFGIAVRADAQSSSYAAIVTLPDDINPRSPVNILAASNHPLPFVGERSIPGWDYGVWTKLGLSREGNQYKFYVNDRLVLSYIAPERLRETIVSIGTNSHGSVDVARCEFDYFKVWVKQLPG